MGDRPTSVGYQSGEGVAATSGRVRSGPYRKQGTPSSPPAQPAKRSLVAIASIKATFDQVHFSDDGDGPGKGAGDLWWYFDTSFTAWADGWHRSTSSGDSFTVPAERGELGAIYSNVGKAVTVTLQAAEDDVSLSDFGCSGLFTKWIDDGPYIGSNTCAQHSSAQANAELPTYVWEDQPKAFSASPPSRTPLGFSVTGTIQVTYA